MVLCFLGQKLNKASVEWKMIIPDRGLHPEVGLKLSIKRRRINWFRIFIERSISYGTPTCSLYPLTSCISCKRLGGLKGDLILHPLQKSHVHLRMPVVWPLDCNNGTALCRSSHQMNRSTTSSSTPHSKGGCSRWLSRARHSETSIGPERVNISVYFKDDFFIPFKTYFY